MLTLNPGLMRSMDTDHLVRSLECEPPIMRTPVELELMRRCYDLADEVAASRELVEAATNFSPEPTGADIVAIGESHTANWQDCAKMLALLNDAEIETVEQLKALIESTKEKPE